MKNITLSDKLQANVTILPNEFIDEYMIPADGEYVKIYLLILRLIGDGYEVSQELLADLLDLTQKDVARAISYWVEAGILTEETGTGTDVGADIFRRGLCLPSDNKTTAEQQDIIIDIIHRCFQ